MKSTIARISVFVLLLIMVVCAVLVSCGNRSFGLGTYTYKHIYVNTYGENGVCIDIDKWYENDTGVEVLTSDGNGMFFSEGTYVMIEEKEKCPFCN